MDIIRSLSLVPVTPPMGPGLVGDVEGDTQVPIKKGLCRARSPPAPNSLPAESLHAFSRTAVSANS